MGEPIEVPSGPAEGFAEVSDSDPVDEAPDASAMLSNSVHVDLSRQPLVEEPCSDEECSDDIGSSECGTAVPCASDSSGSGGRWISEISASALQSQMAVGDSDEWPHEFGPAGRVSLGYEWPDGLGVRSQVWAYSMEGEIRDQLTTPYFYYPYSFYDGYYGLYSQYYIPGSIYQPFSSTGFRRLELTAVTAYFDFYKSFHSQYGDLALGMGPAFGYLDFSFEPYGAGSQYNGGGVTLFGQGSLPLIHRNRWEIVMTGQTRVTLLAGSWDIDGLDIYDDSEHSENMSILELRFGPEFRLKLGRRANRTLFLQTLAEFQQWQSDRMGPIAAGDTLGLQGVTMNLGTLW